MEGPRKFIRFRLNDTLIELADFSPSLTLLDYLRIEKRLSGTKEGCAEGDCGACTVLVGRLLSGRLVYETVNACIRFVGSLDGCHVVTIEHLKDADGKLHPVQQAMVDHHGSQCGFCTPGFVMSLYGLWMENPNPTNAQVETALQGNLCRCTGYAPIIRAAQAITDSADPGNDPLVLERESVSRQLGELKDGRRVEVVHDGELFIVPCDVRDLADARKQYPDSTIVSGSTDVGLWVTKFMREISPVIFIAHLEELQQITVSDQEIEIGACVTYTQMQAVIDQQIPQLKECWNRIGGAQVRNMGTVGGNVANGSPIGDTPPALIALGATLVLRNGENRRSVPLQDFFIEYGKQDREPGDFVESLVVPLPSAEASYAVYKISKRRDEDISSVLGAFYVEFEAGVVTTARIAFGGMAGTPKRASNVEAQLRGKPWQEETIASALHGFEADFSALSDWRASAEYRNLVARNLLQRFFLEHNGSAETVRLQREIPSVEVSA